MLSKRLEDNWVNITYSTKDTWCKDLAFALDYLHLHLQSHKKIYAKYVGLKFIKLNILVTVNPKNFWHTQILA